MPPLRLQIPTLFLAASLAANVALVACLVVGTSDEAPPAAPTAIPTASVTATSAAGTGSPPSADAWAALETGDLAAQRDRLRAEGFPPALVRAILAAQIREGFAARRKAIEAAQPETPFWKTQSTDPQTRAALLAIAKDQQKALTDLLGPDPENGTAAALQRQFPNLSADKVAQLAALRDDDNHRRSDHSANQSGALGVRTAADQEKLTALEKGLHSDLAAILTPQELEDYDLRTSNTASQLRYSLTAFDASEQEFRTLYQLQQAFNDRIGPQSGSLTPDERKARNEAQTQLDADIKAALGDTRYAEYQRANDYNYRQTTQLVARLELPPETANQLYAVQQDIQQRVNALRTTPNPPAADQQQQLTVLVEEAKTKVNALLGPRGAAVYPTFGGQWLQNITPRPAITRKN